MLKRLLLVALFCLIGDRAFAQCAPLPYTLTNGTIAEADQVMANFNAVNTCAQGATAQTATNATMAALLTSSVPQGGIWRLGFAAKGDAPATLFLPENGTCAGNSRVNDGGSCVNTTSGDGNSFYAVYPGMADVRSWGAKGDGATDGAAALQAAATASAANGWTLVFPGLTFVACSATITLPNNTNIYGMPKSKIQTQSGCVGPAATSLILLPTNALTSNPLPVMGRIENLTLDGFAVSQYVLNSGSSQIGKWAFPGVTVINAKASTVTSVATNGTTAAGNNVLHFAGTAAATVGAVVDDITRTGIIPAGTTVASCSPNCGAATSVTLSVNVTAWDDGTGVNTADSIRFMTPTANVLLQGGYEYDFSNNFNIYNGNEEGAFYSSQTTLPMAGLYIIGASDSLFDGITIRNAMYGVLDTNGFGNSFTKHAHIWGQGVNNPTGQPFDLRPQYCWAQGGGDWINSADCDDAQLAGIYISFVSGIPGMRVRDYELALTAAPVGGYANDYAVLIGAGVQDTQIVGTRAFDLSFQGQKQNIVYQRGNGQPQPSVLVRDNTDALYTTAGYTFSGNTVTLTNNQTTFLGPTGQSTTQNSYWVSPNGCFLTGLFVSLTAAPGVGQSHTFTVMDGGVATALTATITGAAFGTGTAYPPSGALTGIAIGAGDAIVLRDVVSATAASPTATTYRIYTSCN